MALIDTALPKFEELFREVYETTERLRFHDKYRQHILAVSLHGSIIELAFGILTLLKKGNGTPAWVLARSLLEAFADLKNIVSEPKYDEFMHAAFLDQQRRTIGIAKGRGASNPYLGSLVTDPAVAQHGQWVESELKRYKDAGIIPLKVKERFERADLLDLYDGPYSHLSQRSHNNLSALEERHIDPSPQGFSVHYFREIPDDGARLLIDTCAGILANSLATVKSLLEGDPPTGLEGVTARLSELRQLWREAPNTGPQADG